MTKFFRGGGTSANTISDVPSAIDGMLGQYKKVAIGKCNIKIPANRNVNVEIPLNLKFTPKMVFIGINLNFESSTTSENFTRFIKAPHKEIINVTGFMYAKDFTVSKQKVTFVTANSLGISNSGKITDWIAIE